MWDVAVMGANLDALYAWLTFFLQYGAIFV